MNKDSVNRLREAELPSVTLGGFSCHRHILLTNGVFKMETSQPQMVQTELLLVNQKTVLPWTRIPL